MAFDAAIFDREWTNYAGSFHEAAHACTARHFDLPVIIADMRKVTVDHRWYSSADCEASRQRLVVSAAGDAYTEMFLKYGHMGSIDDARSRARLRDLGASESLCKQLMSDARREAEALVFALRLEIAGVAAALRTHGTLNQDQIDTAMSLPQNRHTRASDFIISAQ